jgi:hypothetical protein
MRRQLFMGLTLAGAAIVILMLVFLGGSQWGRRQVLHSSGKTRSTEIRVDELENEVAALHLQIQEQGSAPSAITVIPFDLDTIEFAQVLKEVYKETDTVKVEALPELKCIVIKADRISTQEIRLFLKDVCRQANQPVGELKCIILGPPSPDLEEAVRLINQGHK